MYEAGDSNFTTAGAHHQTRGRRSKSGVTLNSIPKTPVAACSNRARMCTSESKVCTNELNSCRHERAPLRLALNKTEQNPTLQSPAKIPLRPSPSRRKSHKNAQDRTLLHAALAPMPPSSPRHAPSDLAKKQGIPGVIQSQSHPVPTPMPPHSSRLPSPLNIQNGGNEPIFPLYRLKNAGLPGKRTHSNPFLSPLLRVLRASVVNSLPSLARILNLCIIAPSPPPGRSGRAKQHSVTGPARTTDGFTFPAPRSNRPPGAVSSQPG
jgi:hypothetical protein